MQKYSEIITISLLLFCFVLQVGSFIFYMSPGMGPDEMFHLQFIEYHQKSAHLSPFSEGGSTLSPPLEQFKRFGEMTEAPWLYHLSLGSLMNVFALNTFDFSTVVTLRFISLFLAVLFILLSYFLSKELGLEFGERILVCSMLVSLPMLTVLSASVNYDSYNNLFCLAALFYLAKLFKQPSLDKCFLIALLLGLGLLVKITTAPLVVLVVIAILLKALFDWRKGKLGEWVRSIKLTKLSQIALCILTFTTLAFVAYQYVGNISQYGSVYPSCDKIFDHNSCLDNYYFNRTAELKQQLEVSPDKFFSRYLLEWSVWMIGLCLGIKAMTVYWPGNPVVVFTLCLMVVSAAGVVLQRKNIDQRIWTLFAIASCYLVFIASYLNYPYYLQVGDKFINITINGRYSFPVLTIIVIFVVSGLKHFKPLQKKSILLVLSLGFLLLGLPRFFFFAEAKNDFLAPADLEFYKNLPYYPNPVYDSNFKVLRG